MSKEQFFEKIKSYKFLANKSLGQNFLINPEIAEIIVEKLKVLPGDNVLEIGAGLGSLSYFLKDYNDSEITLIDVDERMLAALNNEFGNISNVTIKRQNILKEDLDKYTKIIGNLPYYITSGIIEHILLKAKNTSTVVLMTQKEVYPKLLKTYSSPLSLFLNYVADISAPTTVTKSNFYPMPHVESVVFVLKLNQNIKNEHNLALLRLMQKLFLHRRKTMLNCLQSIVGDKKKSKDLLDKSSIEQTLRPEQLSIDDYLVLLKQLKSSDFMAKILK